MKTTFLFQQPCFLKLFSDNGFNMTFVTEPKHSKRGLTAPANGNGKVENAQIISS